MSDDTENEEEELSPLNMSDEDMLNAPLPDLPEEKDDEEESEEELPDKDEETGNENTEEDEEESTTAGDDKEEEEESNTDDNQQDDSSDKAASTENNDEEKTDTKKDEDTETKDTETSINYESEHKKLLAPFRANGKDIQVASVDDAITLMKMGANYNKKMAGLKPNLKLLKMLENNKLLDEGKLSYLIDLDQKNPNAIQKLIKESGVDPLDIDLEKDTDYKPNTYTVDDNEVELDGVLDDIRDTTSFKDTIEIISNKWDAPSRKLLLENPEVISVINGHVESGIYDQINTIVESERMLGRLTGLSDLAAYKQVGDVLKANGGFVNQKQQESNAEAAKPAKQKQVDPKLKDRKRAASSTKATKSNNKKADFNPLSISDEEFEKIATSKYM